jgi:hypothetical protein
LEEVEQRMKWNAGLDGFVDIKRMLYMTML